MLRAIVSTLTTGGALLQAGLPGLKTLYWLVQNAISQKVPRMCSYLRLVNTMYSLSLQHLTTTKKGGALGVKDI